MQIGADHPNFFTIRVAKVEATCWRDEELELRVTDKSKCSIYSQLEALKAA